VFFTAGGNKWNSGPNIIMSTSAFQKAGSGHFLYIPIISLYSNVLNSNTLFGQCVNEPTSKSYLCCSAAFTE